MLNRMSASWADSIRSTISRTLSSRLHSICSASSLSCFCALYAAASPVLRASASSRAFLSASAFASASETRVVSW
jgi:hypothetical protein